MDEWDAAAEAATRRVRELLGNRFTSPDGEVERQRLWQTDTGWIVGYTTTKVMGGPHDGKYATMAYKPLGKGARSGEPENGWERVYFKGAAKRRVAKDRALRLHNQHTKDPRKLY